MLCKHELDIAIYLGNFAFFVTTVFFVSPLQQGLAGLNHVTQFRDSSTPTPKPYNTGHHANAPPPPAAAHEQPHHNHDDQQQQWQQQQRHAGSRRLLLVLHGKRIYDEQIRRAIMQLREEGHEVRSAALCCSSSSVRLASAQH
jgi:hypothetical protein